MKAFQNSRVYIKVIAWYLQCFYRDTQAMQYRNSASHAAKGFWLCHKKNCYRKASLYPFSSKGTTHRSTVLLLYLNTCSGICEVNHCPHELSLCVKK